MSVPYLFGSSWISNEKISGIAIQKGLFRITRIAVRSPLTDHLSRYGTRSTHMGPKIIGFRVFAPEIGRPRERLFPSQHLNVDQVKLDFFAMSLTEIAAADLENNRRKQVVRIRQSIDDNFATLPVSHSPPPSPSPLRVKYRKVTPSQKVDLERCCPRFDEIKEYLFRNRRELALDTLNFAIPEHTMLGYILANGGLALTPEEWKYFLSVCGHSKLFFS
jgi:hypothetical protein